MEIYKDILTEIAILEARLEDLEKEYRHIWNSLMPRTSLVASYDGMPREKYTSVPLDRSWEDLKAVQAKIDRVEERLKEKRELAAEIKGKLAGLEGLEKRVAYMFDIEKKSLNEIAAETGYSYHYVAKINSRRKKNSPA